MRESVGGSVHMRRKYDAKGSSNHIGDRVEFESMQQGEDDSVVIMDNDTS